MFCVFTTVCAWATLPALSRRLQPFAAAGSTFGCLTFGEALLPCVKITPVVQRGNFQEIMESLEGGMPAWVGGSCVSL